MHLTLKHFVLRAKVLNLYRHSIRASQSIPDVTARKETIAWIRGEFERNKHITDVALIEDQLSQGRSWLRRWLYR